MNKIKSKILTVVMVVMLFCAAYLGLIEITRGTTFLSNTFEVGNTSEWDTATTGGSGSITVGTPNALVGTYSAYCQQSSDADTTELTDAVSASGTSFYIATALNFSDIAFTNGEYLVFLRVLGAGGWNPLFRIVIADSGNKIGLDYKNSSDEYVSKTSATGFAINTPYWFVINYTHAASGAVYRVYLNDVEIEDLQSIDTTAAQAVPNSVSITTAGQRSYSGALRYYVDNVVVDSAYPTNPLGGGEDTTAPTFGTITSNSTLAGNGTRISCTISDNVAVDFWRFAHNNTGVTVNGSLTDVSGSPISAYFDLTWNATVGNKVWVQFWANDTSNNGAYSSVQTFTLTVSETTFNVPSDGWNYGYCGWNLTSVTPTTVQDAVTAAISYSGSNNCNVTIILAAGDWAFSTGVTATLSGLSTGNWLNIVGSWTNTTATTYSTQVTCPQVILRSDSNSDGFEMFVVAGAANKHFRATGLTLFGKVPNDSTGAQHGFMLTLVDGYRIDHCHIDSFAGACILPWKSKGLIDHCNIFQSYHNENPSAIWGYGVQSAGNVSSGVQDEPTNWKSIDTFLGLFDTVDYRLGLCYVENCYFTNCRHGMCSSQGGWYVVRHSTFSNATQGLYLVDIHGNQYPAGMGAEFYNNTVLGKVGASNGFNWQGGMGTCYNNTWTNLVTGLVLSASGTWTGDFANPQNVHNMTIWNNVFNSVTYPLRCDLNPSYRPEIEYWSDIGLYVTSNGTTFPATSPSIWQNYVAYPYPHPWVSGVAATYYTLTVESTAGGSVSPTVGNHELLEGTNQTLIATPSGGYSFVDWEIDGVNQTATATWYVVMDNDHTAKAYFKANTYTISLTITNPESTTYNVPSIPVSLSSSGNDTSPAYSWNFQFSNSSWLYGTNQTGTSATMIIAGNATGTFACKVTGAHGSTDYGEVALTVEIITGPDTYTLTLIITNPQNTTYTTNSIPVSLSFSGNDTNPTYTWNFYFGNGSTLFAENQTSTSTTLTINENCTGTFACYIIGDNLADDHSKVEFTVLLTEDEPNPSPSPSPTLGEYTTAVSNFFTYLYLAISLMCFLPLVIIGIFFFKGGYQNPDEASQLMIAMVLLAVIWLVLLLMVASIQTVMA